jgi:trk system potassium uptake protein TrkH
MFLAGTNITMIYFTLKGNFKKIRQNSEFIFYSITVISFIVLVSLFLIRLNGFSAGKALCEAAFEVVSLVSTTGYFSNDHNLWSNAIIILLFTLMFTGGMSGSTSGGIKILRLLIITKNNRQEMKRLIHPSAFIPVRVDRHVVPNNMIILLLVFIILYFITICIGAFVLAVMDYDIITSFSTSASMLANIGPGIGPFGPFENYSAMPVPGKLFLSFLMLLGRLEMVSVLLLLTRGFYRR